MLGKRRRRRRRDYNAPEEHSHACQACGYVKGVGGGEKGDGRGQVEKECICTVGVVSIIPHVLPCIIILSYPVCKPFFCSARGLIPHLHAPSIMIAS